MERCPRSLSRRSFLEGLAGAGVGAALGPWACADEPRLALHRLRDVASREFDACVIGSGPAGVTLAHELARRGFRTVVLESGVRLDAIPPGWDPRRLDVYRSRGSVAYPLHAGRRRAVGGTSSLWTGRCARLHPLDFEPNAYTPASAPWPLRYGDLQRHYAEAERIPGVEGGELSDHHAPRRRPLPGRAVRNVALVRELMAELGLALDSCPTSRSPKAKGPVRVARDLLPALSAVPGVWIVSDATVTRLESDAAGRVGRARVRDTAGTELALRADTYVVACGALESARLLMLSRTSAAPGGAGQPGRRARPGIPLPPNLTLSSRLPDGPERPALARCHEFYDRFKQRGWAASCWSSTTSPRHPG